MPVPRKKTSAKKPSAAKAKSAKPRVPRTRRGVTVRWLLLIDNEPLRREAIAEYHRIEQEIGVARDKVEAFELGDLPAYQRWEARLFGTLLTDLRAAIQGIEEKRAILLEIEEEMFWGRCSSLTAYRRVMKRRKSASEGAAGAGDADSRDHAEPEFEEPEGSGDRMFGNRDLPPDFDIDEFDRMTPRKQKKFRDEYGMMAVLYQMMTGLEAPDLDELLEMERMKRGRRTTDSASHSEAEELSPEKKNDRPAERLKELYRKLVRQLHPDTAKDLTERDRELWHEVQEAYRTRDLDRMEAVAGRIEIGLGGSAVTLSLQVLRRMARDLRDALKGLKSHITTLRKHPAWQFRKKTAELASMEAKRRRALTKELGVAKQELAELTSVLDRYAQPARGPRRRSRKRSFEEEFFDGYPF